MKTIDPSPKPAAAVPTKGRAKRSPLGQPRSHLGGSKAAQSRTRQKTGGYKRVTVVLVDASSGRVAEVRRSN